MAISLLRRVTVPAVAGLVLVSSACSLLGNQEVTASKNHAAVTQGVDVKPKKALPTGDAKDAPEPGRLIGPHYNIGVTGISTAKSANAEKAEAYGFDSPVKAPKGKELLLATIDDSSKASSKVKANITVDGKDRSLDSLPADGGTVATVASKDSDVLLSVTDEKRTQTMNLRDGQRGDEAVNGFYNGKTTSKDLGNYSESGKATGQAPQEDDTTFNPESRDLDISMSVGKAQRSPWDSKAGWAEDDKVWVRVPVSKMKTNSVWGFSTKKSSNEPIMSWKLTEHDAFSLQPNDSDDMVKSEGKDKFKANEKSDPINKAGDVKFDPDSADLLFQVPDDTTKATFHINPKGSLGAKWKDRSGDASWDDAPKKGKIDVEF